MDQVQYLTAEKLELLKAELQDLKTVKRREAADRIEAAKALGDLSENAEYHEAKDALSMIEARIMEIESIIKNAQIIDMDAPQDGSGVVRVGSTVRVRVAGKERTFTIVGSNEADPVNGRISNESPIGGSLLGARAGDEIEVRTPGGLSVYEILEIE